MERNWKIKCGWCDEDNAGAWKGTGISIVDKRRLNTEKEPEDKVWKSVGWSPTRARRIKKAGYRKGTGRSSVDKRGRSLERSWKIKCG